MVLIAAALYLPEHVATVSSRAFYYYTGLHPNGVGSGKAGAGGMGASALADGVVEAAARMGKTAVVGRGGSASITDVLSVAAETGAAAHAAREAVEVGLS